MTQLDTDQYMHFMEEFDMTDAQKREVIEIVWRIMEQFADRAWGMDTKGESNSIIDKFLEDKKPLSKSSKKSVKSRTAGKRLPR